MQKIHCRSETCIHNKDSECAADTILVKGGFANKSENTYCDSFNDSPGAYVINEAEKKARHGREETGRWLDTEFGVEPEVGATEVNCTAAKCVFNEGYRCTANKITINDPRNNARGRSDCRSFRSAR